MLDKLQNNVNEPIEALAIGSLLDIDQTDTNLNVWGDHKIQSKTSPKHNPYLTSKRSQERYFNKIYSPKKRNQQLLFLNKRESQEQILNEEENSEKEDSNNQLKKKEAHFNEGEYWSSKINWMKPSQKKEILSQTRINKKFTFGYEINGRKISRGSIRYASCDKNKQQEFKDKLIYSLIDHQYQGMAKLDSMRISSQLETQAKKNSISCNVLSKTVKNFKDDINWKSKDESSAKMSTALQSTMHETLRKLYFKNNEQTPDLNSFKQSEHERGSIVRQLLINLQNMKQYQTHSKEMSKSDKKQFRISSKEELTIPDVKNRKAERVKNGFVLNLNLQAEKVYENRGVNRWKGRKPSPVMKME